MPARGRLPCSDAQSHCGFIQKHVNMCTCEGKASLQRPVMLRFRVSPLLLELSFLWPIFWPILSCERTSCSYLGVLRTRTLVDIPNILWLSSDPIVWLVV